MGWAMGVDLQKICHSRVRVCPGTMNRLLSLQLNSHHPPTQGLHAPPSQSPFSYCTRLRPVISNPLTPEQCQHNTMFMLATQLSSASQYGLPAVACFNRARVPCGGRALYLLAGKSPPHLLQVWQNLQQEKEQPVLFHYLQAFCFGSCWASENLRGSSFFTSATIADSIIFSLSPRPGSTSPA